MNPGNSESRHRIVSRLVNPAGIVALSFIASRSLYYHLGVRFDATILFYAEQFLDVNLLQGRLTESIFYLHCQPPLFNLFLGAVLKIFPNNLDTAFHLIYLGFSLMMALSVVALMNRLGVPRWLSTMLTVIFVVSPATLLYENWLFYICPVASILSVSALVLHKWLSEGKLLYGLIFFICIACLVLTWSLFQLLWVAAVGLIVGVYGRIRWQSVVAAAAIPLILVASWHLKNWYYFGVFRTSSWMGMNLARTTAGLLSPEETEALVDSGRLSKLPLVPVFSHYDEYWPYLPEPPETDVPVLNEKEKEPPSVGANYNYIGYLAVSQTSLDDAIYAIKCKPYKFMENVLDALLLYLAPASDYQFVEPNRNRISLLVSVHNAVLSGSLKPGEVGLLIVYSLIISVGCGAYLAVRWIRKRPTDAAYAGTVMFVWLTILYVVVVVSLLERFENNRMRFITEPYVLIILGVVLDRVRRRCLAHREVDADAHRSVENVRQQAR